MLDLIIPNIISSFTEVLKFNYKECTEFQSTNDLAHVYVALRFLNFWVYVIGIVPLS